MLKTEIEKMIVNDPEKLNRIVRREGQYFYDETIDNETGCIRESVLDFSCTRLAIKMHNGNVTKIEIVG